ncbi:MAG: DUF975 family protein [Bacillota bacterium]|nr:DUF975 family protein [Bacillota bacterium]
MLKARDFRAQGRAALAGNWPIAILVVLISSLLGGSGFGGNSLLTADYSVDSYAYSPYIDTFDYSSVLPSFQPWQGIYGLLILLIGGAVLLGLCCYFLKLLRGQPAAAADLFSRFRIWLKALGLSLFMGLFIVLWSLLLIVPGVIAYYRYSMAPYLMADDTNIGIRQAVNVSKQMMDCHKGRLFCLDISFIGWVLLAAIPSAVFAVFVPAQPLIEALLSFIALLPVVAYMQAARAAFFLDRAGSFFGQRMQQQQPWQQPQAAPEQPWQQPNGN